MKIQVVDPPAYTPSYDHELCAALARRGSDVELITSEFDYGAVPKSEGYGRKEHFYSRRLSLPRSLRQVGRLIQHVPDMLSFGKRSGKTDVVHWQWLSVQQVDWMLLPRNTPQVLTAHDVLPREPKFGQHSGQRRLYDRMDAVIVHSEHGAQRLRDEVGIEADRIHVIEHGVLDSLTQHPKDAALPVELAKPKPRGPVVLFFGLIRPYKGLDLLLEAWRSVQDDLKDSGAELWVVGMPRMPIEAMRATSPSNVRWVPRYVEGGELAATFRAADMVVLPYTEIDQSGVLFTALAFGKPMILSSVGGFPEVARTGAGEVFETGDVDSLAESLTRLIADSSHREQLAAAARAAASPDGRYGWDSIAERTLKVYESIGLP